jgi:uncharacterized protein (TIGR02246 family)
VSVKAFFAICIAAMSALLPVRSLAAPTDEQQIAAVYQHFAAAIRQKSADGIMSLFVPGPSLFVFDVTPPRQHVGWNDYRDDWKSFFALLKGNPTAASVADLSTTISGDVAYTHSIQHFSAALAKGGTVDLNVRVTDVLRKIDGKWLIVQEHVSVPVDVLTGKADLLSRP